jgi:hypothetical protein
VVVVGVVVVVVFTVVGEVAIRVTDVDCVGVSGEGSEEK